jgi:hypothetical protein
MMVGTGHEIEKIKVKYIGTTSDNVGLVFHLFEII